MPFNFSSSSKGWRSVNFGVNWWCLINIVYWNVLESVRPNLSAAWTPLRTDLFTTLRSAFNKIAITGEPVDAICSSCLIACRALVRRRPWSPVWLCESGSASMALPTWPPLIWHFLDMTLRIWLCGYISARFHQQYRYDKKSVINLRKCHGFSFSSLRSVTRLLLSLSA